MRYCIPIFGSMSFMIRMIRIHILRTYKNFAQISQIFAEYHKVLVYEVCVNLSNHEKKRLFEGEFTVCYKK